MRFLHTSDWHLGKIFYEYSLIEDQRNFLNQIVQILEKGEAEGHPYSGLLVPGDIYDRAVPPAEATEIFSEFLSEVNKKFPELHMFFISGNHDSPSRLAFGTHFFKAHNIHIVTDCKNYAEPVIVERGGEKTAVYSLPYLYPLAIESEDKNEDGNEKFLRSQQDLYEKACSKIIENHNKNYKELPLVLCAHLFTMGSCISKSERSNVGTAEQVDVSLFKDFDYGAFGHIHGNQSCDKEQKCWYSGAPLAYNFDDSENTFFLDVEISSRGEKPFVNKIPVTPLHSIARLEGNFSDFYGVNADSSKWKKYKDCFVHVNLKDEVPVNNAYDFLKTVFPNLLLITRKTSGSGENTSGIQQRKQAIQTNNPELIFSQFLNDVYGNNLEETQLIKDEKELMKKSAEEIKWGENL